MADFVLNIEGRLDKGKTKENIQKELSGNIGQEINAKRPLQIIGSLDLTKTQQRIQSQLATISKNLTVDINIGKIDISSATEKMANGTQQINNSLKGTTVTVDEVKKKFDELFNSDKLKGYLDKLDSAKTKIDKLSVTARGEDIESISFTGTDKLGQEIKILQKEDEVITHITDNVAKQRQEQERAAKKAQQEVEKHNKLLERQHTLYANLNQDVKDIGAKYTKGRNPLDGLNPEDAGQALSSANANVQQFADKYKELVIEVEKFNTALESGDVYTQAQIDHINELIKETKRLGTVAKEAQSTQADNRTKKVDSQVAVRTEQLKQYEIEVGKLGDAGTELRSQLEQLQTQLSQVGNDSHNLDNFNNKLDEFKAKLQTVKMEQRQQANPLDKSNFLNQIDMWLQNNTKATQATIAQIERIKSEVHGADNLKLSNLKKEFRGVTQQAQLAGKAGKSLLDIAKEKIGKFTSWFSIAQGVMKVTREFVECINTLKEVDTLLTEISKTSDMTDAQLEKLGYTAFESAKQYGITVQAFLSGVQEMSRAGYENAEQMAELSTLAQAAGDMTAEVANNYLIATDAAYEFNGSVEELSKVLDGQNKITNNYAISMTDIAEATSKAASMASSYGVSIEELSAITTMAVARTRQTGDEAGNAIKSLMVNLTDLTNKKRVAVFEMLGISMTKMVDGAEQLKTPIQLLDELADVYNKLPEGDTKRATLLNVIGGKRQANTLAAILQGWKSLNGIIDTYKSGVGSASEEATKNLDSIQGRLNNIKNTSVQIVQGLVNGNDMKSLLKVAQTLLDIIHSITKDLGLFGSVLTGLGIFGAGKGFKGLISVTKAANDLVELFDAGADVSQMANAIKGLTAEQQRIAVVSSIVSESLREEILAENGVTISSASATTATDGLTASQSRLATSTMIAKNATIELGKGLKALLSDPIILGGAVALTAIVVAYKHFNKIREEQHEAYEREQQEHEELIESLKEETQQRETNLNTLKEVQDEYEKIGNKTSYTAEEEKRLAEIQETLTSTYTKLASGIDLVNGKYDENIEKLKEINKIESTRQRQEMHQLYQDTVQGNTSNGAHQVGSAKKYGNNVDYITAMSNYGIGIKSIQYKDKHLGALDFSRYQSVEDELVQFYVDSTLSVEEVINNIDNAISNIERDYDESDLKKAENKGVAKVKEDLIKLRSEYIDIRDSNYQAALADAQATIFDFESNGVNFQNVTEETYQAWRDAMVKQFASDDPVLRGAIDDTLTQMYDWLQEDIEKTKVPFSFTSWFTAYDVKDIEDEYKKVKDVIKDIYDGKDITGEDRDVLSAFGIKGDLTDIDNVTKQFQKLTRDGIAPLRYELNQLYQHSYRSPIEQAEIKSAIDYLDQLADVTSEVTDLYKEQQEELKKQIYTTNQNLQNAKRRKEAEEQVLDVLKKQKETLEKQIDQYESAAQAVQDYIQDQIDSLNKQKSTIEETYEKQISALQEEEEERERINDLREKELALENAKNSKIRTYSAGGFQILENKEAIKSAQAEYDKALNDSKIAQLEKERDEAIKPIEEQIKALEDYKDAWSEALNHFKKVQNEMYANAVLGANWREAVMSQDVNMVSNFVSTYDGLQNQLHNIVEPQIEQKEREIEVLEKEIDGWNDLMDKQKSYLDFFKKYSDDIAKAVDKQRDAFDKFLNTLNEGKDKSAIFRAFDEMMAYFDSDYLSEFGFVPEYANGGLANYTGTAMLHGTSNKAELILNNADARKLYDVIHSSTAPQLAKSVVGNMFKTVKEQGLENISTTNNHNNSNNYYTWTVTGNDIHADSYSEFKENMDRFVREARMDLDVGKR